VIYKIRIDGLKVYAYHGVMQHEKDFGQEFFIDANLDVDSSGEDQIESTVSYALVAEEIVKLVTTQRFDLIESLAKAITNQLLELDPRILRVTITVHKPNAPIGYQFKDVSVSVSGARGEN
jgi:dihydroneopterin aldolase